MKTKTKSIMTICLAVALVVAAVVGTIAYMTATDSVENTFTVGSFEKPTTDPTDPDKTISLDGYIYEPSWVEKSKLVPGDNVAKDPYVGIGKGSDTAWVYVYIKNETLASSSDKYVTFTLKTGWTAVDATTVTDSEGNTKYVSGLFKYNTVLTPDADKDAWTTTPIFEEVNVSKEATNDKFATSPKMTVYAYIHQAHDDAEGEIPASTINANATAWAAGL